MVPSQRMTTQPSGRTSSRRQKRTNGAAMLRCCRSASPRRQEGRGVVMVKGYSRPYHYPSKTDFTVSEGRNSQCYSTGPPPPPSLPRHGYRDLTTTIIIFTAVDTVSAAPPPPPLSLASPLLRPIGHLSAPSSTRPTVATTRCGWAKKTMLTLLRRYEIDTYGVTYYPKPSCPSPLPPAAES